MILNKEDYQSFLRLGEDKDFQHWRKIVDEFQNERAKSLLSGTLQDGVDEDAILKDFRGGYKLWSKAVNLIDNAEDNLLLNETEIKTYEAKIFGETIANERIEEESK